MTSDLSIRQFRRDEWLVYRDLRLRALKESPDAFGSTLERELEFPDQECQARIERWVSDGYSLPLVAHTGEQSVGILFARRESDANAIVELYSMWVDPVYRKCGAARELVQKAIDWARGIGAAQIVLRVTETNKPAIGLYERCGFLASESREPLAPGSELFAIKMVLAL